MAKLANLMEKFRDGSEAAFRHFMSLHLRALTFYAYKFCKNKEVAEEIVSDTFSKLWQRKEKFENEHSIRSFLYTATRNASLDYLRSSEYLRVTQKMDDSQSVELDEYLSFQDDDPLTHLIYAELIQSLMHEIERLPRRQKNVFHMIYIDGLSIDEICSQLKITPNAVYIAKKKALTTLRITFSDKEWTLLLLLFQF